MEIAPVRATRRQRGGAEEQRSVGGHPRQLWGNIGRG